MEFIGLFAIGLFFSFIGSIPPGTINVSVLQLSIAGHYYAALRFGVAAALVEYIYAVIAIHFQFAITSSPLIQANFHVIAATVMILLGLINIWAHHKPNRLNRMISSSGFRKGLIISILNPLAIPFWIGVTAYLEHEKWISLTKTNLYIYVLGISTGTFLLLFSLTTLSNRVAPYVQNNKIVKLVPGFIFLFLGCYSFFKFLLN